MYNKLCTMCYILCIIYYGLWSMHEVFGINNDIYALCVMHDAAVYYALCIMYKVASC